MSPAAEGLSVALALAAAPLAGRLVRLSADAASGGARATAAGRTGAGAASGRGVAPPAVELAALALTSWAALTVEPPLLWPSAALGWTLLGLALVDLRRLTLPDAATLGLCAAGLGLGAAGLAGSLALNAAGAAAGWLALAGFGAAYRRLRGREGIGLGDAKLAAAAGAWVGPEGLPTVVLWGAVATLAAVALSSRARRRLRRLGAGRARAPFGPGLAAGLWLVWLYGPL